MKEFKGTKGKWRIGELRFECDPDWIDILPSIRIVKSYYGPRRFFSIAWLIWTAEIKIY